MSSLITSQNIFQTQFTALYESAIKLYASTANEPLAKEVSAFAQRALNGTESADALTDALMHNLNKKLPRNGIERKEVYDLMSLAIRQRASSSSSSSTADFQYHSTSI